MVDVTVFPDTISNGYYVTYYGITVQKNLSMIFQSPIQGVGSVAAPSTFSLGRGALIVAEGISATSSMFSVNIRTFTAPGNIRMPGIQPNNRSFGSALDRSQIIPLRSNETTELVIVIKRYEEAGSSLDGLSQENRKIFSRNVINNISNVKSTKVVINSLVNNYAFRASKKII